MPCVNMLIKADGELASQAKDPAESSGFDLHAEDPFYSKENIDFLLKSCEQIKSGLFVEKTLDELERMASEN